jgi:hypothetical protein
MPARIAVTTNMINYGKARPRGTLERTMFKA